MDVLKAYGLLKVTGPDDKYCFGGYSEVVLQGN